MAAPTSQYQHHPLPSPPQPQLQHTPPVEQQLFQTIQPAAKAKTKTRSFSFRSDKSRRNSISHKIDLRETHAEKDARRLHSKADPTLAMNEAEPAVVAATVATSIAPLRAIQHRDPYGNIIADPDKSNPTRNRWERPLDTIRSFEAAIEGDYARKSMYRSDMNSAASRRNSNNRSSQPRFPQDSYYGNRAASFRGDGSQFATTNPGSVRNSYYDNQSYNGNYSHNHGQGDFGDYGIAQDRYPTHPPARTHSEPPHPHPHPHPHQQNSHHSRGREQQTVYPLSYKDRSYETVTSAAASGSSEAAGYQTDPTSSDNSSIHRTSPIKPVKDYGIGFSQSHSYASPELSPNFGTTRRNPLPGPPAPIYHNNPQQAVSPGEASVIRRQTPQQPQQHPQQQHPQRRHQRQQQQQPAVPEKRKSWLSRRFSKKS